MSEIAKYSTGEKPVGRPSAETADRIALDDLARSPEKLKALTKALKQHSIALEQNKSRTKTLNDDIKATAKDSFGISTRKYRELLAAIDSADISEKVNVLSSTVDIVELIKENLEK